MYRVAGKVIQSLYLLISHQMRPYYSFKAFCRPSYIYFAGTWELGQYGKTGTEYSKSYAGAHKNEFKVFSPSFNVK